MAFRKVKIVYDPEEQDRCPNGCWALYSTYFDVAAGVDEKALDEVLEKDSTEIAEFYAKATYPG